MQARTLGKAVVAIEALERKILFSAPTSWSSRGPGGGGAFFAPSFSPYNGSELFVASDMSGLYRSTDTGASWSIRDFREVHGNRGATVNFTSDPNTLYTLDYTEIQGSDSTRPTRSTDGGTIWTPLSGWAGHDPAFGLWADPTNTSNLLVNDYGTLYFSNNGGQSFASKFTAPNSGQGCYVGGVFFDGVGNIYVGTSAGLLVSNNNGTSFSLSSASGIAAGESILSLAGARQNGVTRLMCVTIDSANIYNGVLMEDLSADFKSVYALDVGQTNWVSKNGGIPSGEFPHLISMTRGDISTAYIAGTGNGDPIVVKTTNGGAIWSDVLHAPNNQNVATGWQGQGGDRDWSFGETAMGFQVDPADANRLAFTDFGFVHLSTDGGSTWRQAYLTPADQNPAGTSTPQHKAYHGVGLEDTSALWLTWADANNLVAGYTDIRGVRSANGGASWSFPTNISLAGNTVYQISSQPTANGVTLYAATSSVHDIYQSTRLTDSPLDSGAGSIIVSTDKGVTWSTLHNFANPVVYTAIDPINTQRMFASVVDSSVGGIYVTNNLGAEAASTWTKLPSPPRTEGHPYNVVVLNDGTVVATYSARRNSNSSFTASSGVFVSTDHGQTWADLTLMGATGAPGMQYWTKDITIDPTDPNQNTWWAAVRGGFGGDGSSNNKGGLYKTINRGVNWTRVFSTDNVESSTINPTTHEMYLSTNASGLWYGTNFDTATPTFTQTSYPFRQPERVFINPNNTSEVWVSSFGYGLAVGTTAVAPSTSVSGRSLFYNNSKFDNYTPGVTVSDGASIATDKSALLDGQTAPFNNFSNSSDGITGIFIDFAGIPTGPLTAADFGIKVGNSNAPASWVAGPDPVVTVHAGIGGANSQRVALTWAAGAIKNEWVQVTVLANGHTNLSKNDVFYFGNAVGDATGDGLVTATDYYGVRDHLRSYDSPAPIDWKWDFNRDGVTDITDLMITRAASGGTSLQLITLSPGALASPATKSSSKRTLLKRRSVSASRPLSGWRVAN